MSQRAALFAVFIRFLASCRPVSLLLAGLLFLPVTAGAVTTSLSVPSTDSDGSFTVYWSINTSAGGYSLLKQRVNGGSWNVLVSKGMGSQSYAISVSQSGTYEYKVDYTYYPQGHPVAGSIAPKTTVVSLDPPASVPSVSAPSTDNNGYYTVDWNSVSGAETYKWQQRVNSGSWSSATTTTSTSVTRSGQNSATYRYRVKACNGNGCTNYSSAESVIVAIKPGVPSSISISPDPSTGNVTVNWGSASGSVSYYDFDYKKSSTGSWSSGYNGGSQSRSLSNLSVGTWNYRVRACKTQSSYTSCSGWRTGNSTIMQPPSSAPSLSAPASDHDGDYAVSWGSVSGASSYKLQERVNGGSWSTIQNNGSTSDSRSGKSSGNNYGYRVKACNAVGCSSYSSVKTVKVGTRLSVPGSHNNGSYNVSWSGGGEIIRLFEKFGAGGSWSQILQAGSASGSYPVTQTYNGTYYHKIVDCHYEGTAGGPPILECNTSPSDTDSITVSGLNNAPSISSIGNRTINEDGSTGNIGFNVSDPEDSSSSLTVTAASSNTSLVPNSNLNLGGSGGSRTIEVTPKANQSGSATITVTVSDGSESNSESFTVTVNSVNDAPTISNIGNQTINEDGDTGSIGFNVGDVDDSTGSLNVSASSSNTALVPDSGGYITLGGSGGSRTVKVTPAANKTGSATITVAAYDGDKVSTEAFTVTVNAVNDAPTISNIGNRTINEDGSTGNIGFSVGDVDDSSSSLTVTATSNNTSLVPNGNLNLGGSGTSRTIEVTPKANQSGSATMTVTVSDGSKSDSESFTVTVNSVNDAPTISGIGNKTIDEGGSTGAIGFSVDDVESSAGSLTVSASSSNTGVIPNSNIEVGGSGGSRTLNISAKAAGGVGSSTVTVTVSDGQTSRDETFTVTVNDIPAALSVPASDSDGDGTYTISWMGGDEAVRILEKTPGGNWVSISDGSQGTDPPQGQKTLTHIENGTYEYTLQDCYYQSTPGGPVPNCSASDSGSIALSGLNTAPTMTGIGDRTIDEGASTGPIAFTVDDAETAASSLDVTFSVTGAIPSGNVTLGGSGAGRNIEVVAQPFGGGGSATVTVTVSDGQLNADETFTVDVNDTPAALSVPATSNDGTYTLSWTGGEDAVRVWEKAPGGSWVNLSGGGAQAAPYGSQSISHPQQEGTFEYKIQDCVYEGSQSGPVLNCTDTDFASVAIDLPEPDVTAGFSPGAIDEGGSATFTWSASEANDCSATGIDGGSGTGGSVTYNASSNLDSNVTVPVTVTCTGYGGSGQASDTLAVNWINDEPTIAGLEAVSVDEDGTTGELLFMLDDEETDPGQLNVSAGSDNPGLIPQNNISLSGASALRTISLTPAANQSGTATVTVEVDDGGQTVSESFTVTVNPVNDAPTITSIDEDLSLPKDTATDPIGFSISDIDTPLNELSVSAYSSDTALVPNANLVLSGSGANRTVTVMPAAGQTGIATITVEVSDGQDSDSTSFDVSFVGPPETAFDFDTDAPGEFDYSLSDASFLPSLGTGEFVAVTEGNLSVNQGAANYNLPIQLPPAVNSLKPNLSLAYNSRGSNGLLGVGGSLSGLSTISRCSPTVATEGEAVAADSNPRYTNADRLCLDGQKLQVTDGPVPANDGDYWTATEYRTERDRLAQIRPVIGTHTDGSPLAFEVRTKSGLIMTYGGQAEQQNSRIYAPDRENGPISTWALDKVEDRYGNTYEIHYIQNNTEGHYYPKRITWAPGSAVVFTYQNRDATAAGDRSDMPWGYDDGEPYKDPKLLQKVTTYIDAPSGNPTGGDEVRQYTIGYERSPTTDRYRMETVTECGYDENGENPQCAEPLEFDWQDGQLGFEAGATALQSCSGQAIDSNYLQVTDLDNDGYVDLFDHGGTTTALYWGGPGCFAQAGAWATAGAGDWETARAIATPQGQALLVTKEDSNSTTTPKERFVEVIAFDSAGQSTTNWESDTAVEPTALVVTDLNNDGLDDFLFGDNAWIQDGASLGFTSTGAGNVGLQARTTGRPLDYTGDGLADLFVSHMIEVASNDYDYTDITAYANTGGGAFSQGATLPVSDTEPFQYNINFFSQTLQRSGTSTYNVLDVNGDGRLDYAYHRIPDGETEGTWYVRLNTGDGFGPEFDTEISAGTPTNQYSFAYDWDKDGRQDLIVRDPALTDYCQSGQDCWNVLVATYDKDTDGDGLTFEELPDDPFNGNLYGGVANTPTTAPQYQLLRGDFNHDGLVDIYFQGEVWYAKPEQPDLLTAVTNGLGAEMELDYSPLSPADNNGEPLYTPSSQKPTFPQRHAPRNMQVVKRVSTRDGRDGWRDRYYNYTGAKVHVQGRGSLGFEQIKVTNASRQTVTTTTYRQDFPFTGKVDTLQVENLAGELIRHVENTWGLDGGTRPFVYLDTRLERQYKLTTTSLSNPVRVTRIDNTYDGYGALTERTTEVGSGWNGTGATTIARTTTVTNTVDHTPGQWLLGFVTQRQTTVDTGGTPETITTAFTAQTDTLDVKKREDFVGTDIEKTTVTTRNANGVVTGTKVTADDIDYDIGAGAAAAAARETQLADFGTSLIYPGERTNLISPANHVTELAYDERFGKIDSEIAPNGVQSQRAYDKLGRLEQETADDGTVTRIKRFYCDGTAPVLCPSGPEHAAAYLVATEVTNPAAPGELGAPLKIVFYDKLQREIRRQSYSLDGAVVKVDTVYDAAGRKQKVSEPYTGSSAGAEWTVYSGYDALGRPQSVSAPDGGGVSYSYDGLETTETVTVDAPGGLPDSTQTKTTTTNVLGQVTEVIDAELTVDETQVDYTYDALGNLATTKVDEDSDTLIEIEHDKAGNKTRIVDPDAGTIEFAYNGFRELRLQTWEPGTGDEKSMELDYDPLGRKVQRTDTAADGTETIYTWTWDTNQKGRLASKSGNGLDESYTYNSQGRLITQTTTIAGLDNGDFHYGYDAFGRPDSVTYPDNLKIEYRYHAAGIRARTVDVTDTQNPKVLHAVGRSADARGNLYRQLLGNGVMTERNVDPASGRVEQIRSGRLLDGSIANLSGNIQNLNYQFDTLGNLYERSTGRTDLNGLALESVDESFSYDDLNRLKTSDTDWADESIPDRDLAYDYDALGNLTSRSDLGQLAYDKVNGAGVHAVTSADETNYHYDAYGNLVQRGTETLEYNVFNKPTRIDTTSFEYGPDHQRFKQVDGNRTVYYVNGGQYKEIVENGERTTRSTVGGFYVRSVSSSGTEETYLHQDHLGSVEAMSDELGQLAGRMSFGPWGQRQQADWGDGDPTGGQSGTYPTDRGFTGHEMLDATDLVHMNGRVYDPVIGRFLNPDLLVQAPHNSQSYNRYSYVLNNPLSRVDPSGYASEENDGNGDCRGGCPTLEEDLKTLQEFVDGNENFDSVGELVQVYNDGGFTAVQHQAVFGKSGGFSGAAGGGGGPGGIGSSSSGQSTLAGPDNELLNGNTEDRVYIVYTKTNYESGQIYIGRTSGFGDPEKILKARDRKHVRLNNIGFGPANMESALQTGNTAFDYAAIRGREQQLINVFGGVDSPMVANKIRGVSKWNISGYLYHQASNSAFGNLTPYDGYFDPTRLRSF